jgi:hypothetical protein
MKNGGIKVKRKFIFFEKTGRLSWNRFFVLITNIDLAAKQ